MEDRAAPYGHRADRRVPDVAGDDGRAGLLASPGGGRIWWAILAVTPGGTVFQNGEVLPGDTIVCRASNGTVGAVVPERRGGVGNSADLRVDVDADGIATASCALSLAQMERGGS